MFCSPCFLDSSNLKPEDNLYNISFFQSHKSYDLLSIRQPKNIHYQNFSSWSEKDQQFYQFNYRSHKPEIIRKQTADSKLKRNSQQKLRSSHSVTLHPNKIDLGARMPESIQKLTFKMKSQSIFAKSQSKGSCDLRKYLEKRSQAIQKNKQKSQLIVRLREKMVQQDKKRATELENQPAYNVINYPITTVVRKKKYRSRFTFGGKTSTEFFSRQDHIRDASLKAVT